MYLVGFPLLLIPFAIYNIIAFLIPGVSWTDVTTRVPLYSGAEWPMSLGDMLVALAIALLLVEIVKAYRTGGRFLMDHSLSILLLLAMTAEFLLVQRAATATFFLLLVTSLADAIGGLIAMRRPRLVAVPVHDEPQLDSYAVPVQAESVRTEPVPAPAAPEFVPAAAPVAAQPASVLDLTPANEAPPALSRQDATSDARPDQPPAADGRTS